MVGRMKEELMHLPRAILIMAGVVALACLFASAEMRDRAHPEEFFTKTCPTIFIGKVLKINADAMPTTAKVILSLKGNVPLKERDILPKSPGKFAIFPEEFDKAKKGSIGVFFVGDDWSPDVLMKYKHIPQVVEENKGH